MKQALGVTSLHPGFVGLGLKFDGLGPDLGATARGVNTSLRSSTLFADQQLTLSSLQPRREGLGLATCLAASRLFQAMPPASQASRESRQQPPGPPGKGLSQPPQCRPKNLGCCLGLEALDRAHRTGPAALPPLPPTTPSSSTANGRSDQSLNTPPPWLPSAVSSPPLALASAGNSSSIQLIHQWPHQPYPR